jgi:hypothetical protein
VHGLPIIDLSQYTILSWPKQTEIKDTIVSVVVNFKTQLGLVDEDIYPVRLSDVTEKKTKAGDDMVTFVSIITGSDSAFEGRKLTRNFVFKQDSPDNNAGVAYFIQSALLAFGADEEDVTEDDVDIVDYAKQNLVGKTARAEVKHNNDRNDPSGNKKFMSVNFLMEEFD